VVRDCIRWHSRPRLCNECCGWHSRPRLCNVSTLAEDLTGNTRVKARHAASQIRDNAYRTEGFLRNTFRAAATIYGAVSPYLSINCSGVPDSA